MDPQEAVAPGPVVPCLRVFTEKVLVDREGYGVDFAEVDAPLLQLSFEYPDLRARVRASDPRDRFFAAGKGGVQAYPRNREAEANARRLLERFGVVDLDCLDSVGVPPDAEADYMVRVDGDKHAHVAFSAQALPALRDMGWNVEVAGDYPYRCVAVSPSFVANVEPDEERPDWFALELGVDVAGRRLNLLPALVSLLEEQRDGQLSFEDLERRQRPVALEVAPGEHVAVDPGPLRALMRVLMELYDEDRGVVVRGHKVTALETLDKAFEGATEQLVWEGSSHKEARTRAKVLVDAPQSRLEPAGLEATLRPYQREGLAWMQRLRKSEAGGVLADDMGLGKTLQTISHLQTEVSEGRADIPCLVIAPTSLMGNWAREIAKFAPGMRVLGYHGPKRHELWDQVKDSDVVLTSYPLLVRDAELLASRDWHYIVLDEAHVIKNPRSRSHVAACSIPARHKLCLTGTPVENHLGELWALFHFLGDDLLGSQADFKERYRNPIEQYGDEERLETLYQAVAPFILRRNKSEVAKELPPKTQLYKPVELKGKQRELYEAIRIAAHNQVRTTIRKKGIAASTVTILDALTKLRQLCCDPRLVRMEAARFVRESAKYQACMELIETQLAAGHRILLFSQFTTMLDLIGEGLKERGTDYLLLTGQSKDRQGLCDRFESGERDVFLISLKAGGVGLNLVSADTVIHYDPWWNPQAQAQATDRAYRIGQQRPVFVYDLFVAGSVEERMLALQEKKRKLADAILHGNVGSTAFTEDELETLFAPLSR
ncbi:MAG: hypothetical protein CMN30_33345 [Sandaracinus sp.]|nr:hypothetical protein [Sandaracinus sp.]